MSLCHSSNPISDKSCLVRETLEGGPVLLWKSLAERQGKRYKGRYESRAVDVRGRREGKRGQGPRGEGE